VLRFVNSGKSAGLVCDVWDQGVPETFMVKLNSDGSGIEIEVTK